jgi:hypothetical protein
MGNFNGRSIVRATIIALSLLGASSAFACEGKTVIFEDKFEDDLGGWDVDKAITFEKSGMNMKVPNDATSYRELNNAFFIKDADICLEAPWPTTPPDANPGVGIVFWAADYANLFLYQAQINGNVGLYRYVNKNWVTVSSQDAPTLKKNSGDSNLLRITLKGNLVSMYVNGTKLKDIRAQAPTTDARFGVYAQRSKAGSDQIYVFKSIKVTTID